MKKTAHLPHKGEYAGLLFKQNPPEPVSTLLASEGILPADLLICTDTDIDSAGTYHPQWLAVTAKRVVVVSGDTPAAVVISLRMDETQEFRSLPTVGSGLLQARVEGNYIDILRYSNKLADRFYKIARKLDRYLAGAPLEIHPEDEIDPRRCSKCGLRLESAGSVCPRCVSKGAVFARMLDILKPYRMHALAMLFFLLIGIGLDLVPPQLTRYLVDSVLPAGKQKALELKSDSNQMQSHLVALLAMVGILAGVQLLRMGINILNGRLMSKVGTSITFDMRGRLLSHLQQLSISYFDRQQVGSLVARVAYDTEALHGFVAQIAGGFIFQILMVLLVGVMMFSINAKLALFTLLPAPLVIAGSIVFWRYIHPHYYRFWDSSSRQAATLSSMLSGIRVVKSFGQEERELNRFNTASGRLRQSRRTLDMSTATFHPIMGLVFQLGGWIVWFVGGRDVLGAKMTLGDLMAFFGYLWMFYSPLGALTQLTNWLTQFATQAHRIFEILNAPVQIADPDKPVKIDSVRGHIKFEDVSFGYNRNLPVLKDVDLEIQPGEMIGVVGRSGSGKTTIVNLICRFYDVDEGRVLIDGLDVRSVACRDLRSQIGVVLQESFLFRGSIRDNISYGRPRADVEAILAASKAANCHDFIMRANHGYDTWVGEHGAGLSGGERQRISIARVLLSDPRILILDEATSSVDAESEAAIQGALRDLVKGRTTIAIAHRLSTLRNATRILVVDGGKIIESGTHDELLLKDGLYTKLFRMQGQAAAASGVDRLVAEAAFQKDAVRDKPAGQSPDVPSHLLRWLSPENTRFERGHHGSIRATTGDGAVYGGVYAARCLPVQYPSEFVSMRSVDNEKRVFEVGLIRNIANWPAETRALILESLGKRFFVHTIRSIKDIDLFQGYLYCDVDTDLGPVHFVMRWQADRAHDYGLNGKMLVDTDENRYLVPDIDSLPENDRSLFLRFIYW